MNERILIEKLAEHIGEEVVIKGWIDVRRDQGKLIFLDFRDMSGYIQVILSRLCRACDQDCPPGVGG